MAITLADFNKIWASTSPLTPYSFSETNYKQGWNFIGSTPPARQMWDFLQKNNDEKMQYLANNYLPLSGGTMTTGNTLITMGNGESYVRNWGNGLYLGGTNENNASTLALFTNSNAGGFQLNAGDGTTQRRMVGKPDGTLTWDSNAILTANNYNSYALPLSGGTMTGSIQYVDNGKVFTIRNTSDGSVDLGWNWNTREGAGIGLRSTDHQFPGAFTLFARDANNTCFLTGKPDGSLTWDSKEVERVNARGTNYIRYESGLQIVWGGTTATTSGTTVTFPVAFKDKTYRITGATDGYSINMGWESATPTSIKFTTSSSSTATYLEYIIIGQWK